MKCERCVSNNIYANNICKKCYMKEFNKNNYIKNKEKIKKQTSKYYNNNIEVEREKRKIYARKNSADGEHKLYMQEYYESHKEELRAQQKINYYNNSIEYNKKQYEYKKNKLKHNSSYLMQERLASRMRMAIKNHKGIKQSSSIELLGAPINIVRKHLKKSMTSDMSWDNFIHSELHIDHIKPCALFNLTKKNEQLKCFHYTNLQLLWASDNIKKSHNYDGN